MDTASLNWKQLPGGDAMRKQGCAAVTSGEYLLLYGGYGETLLVPNNQALSTSYASGDYYLTNECHLWHLREGEQELMGHWRGGMSIEYFYNEN